MNLIVRIAPSNLNPNLNFDLCSFPYIVIIPLDISFHHNFPNLINHNFPNLINHNFIQIQLFFTLISQNLFVLLSFLIKIKHFIISDLPKVTFSL